MEDLNLKKKIINIWFRNIFVGTFSLSGRLDHFSSPPPPSPLPWGPVLLRCEMEGVVSMSLRGTHILAAAALWPGAPARHGGLRQMLVKLHLNYLKRIQRMRLCSYIELFSTSLFQFEVNFTFIAALLKCHINMKQTNVFAQFFSQIQSSDLQ